MVRFLNFEPSFVSITCQPPSPPITYFVKKGTEEIMNCSRLDYVFVGISFLLLRFLAHRLRVSMLCELLANENYVNASKLV